VDGVRRGARSSRSRSCLRSGAGDHPAPRGSGGLLGAPVAAWAEGGIAGAVTNADGSAASGASVTLLTAAGGSYTAQAGPAICSGVARLELTVRSALRVRQRTMVIASMNYVVRAGLRASLRLRLTRSGSRRLSKHGGRMNVLLVLTSNSRTHRSRIQLARAGARRPSPATSLGDAGAAKGLRPARSGPLVAALVPQPDCTQRETATVSGSFSL
jgi:hypothetical protein